MCCNALNSETTKHTIDFFTSSSKTRNKTGLSVEKQLPRPGRRCKQRRKARKQGQPHLARLILKLVTDAVTVSCVNSIDWVADSLGSLHSRTINRAAVSPATLLNSWQCNYPVWRQGVGVCQTQLATFRAPLDNAFHRRAGDDTRRQEMLRAIETCAPFFL